MPHPLKTYILTCPIYFYKHCIQWFLSFLIPFPFQCQFEMLRQCLEELLSFLVTFCPTTLTTMYIWYSGSRRTLQSPCTGNQRYPFFTQKCTSGLPPMQQKFPFHYFSKIFRKVHKVLWIYLTDGWPVYKPPENDAFGNNFFCFFYSYNVQNYPSSK